MGIIGPAGRLGSVSGAACGTAATLCEGSPQVLAARSAAASATPDEFGSEPLRLPLPKGPVASAAGPRAVWLFQAVAPRVVAADVGEIGWGGLQAGASWEEATDGVPLFAVEDWLRVGLLPVACAVSRLTDAGQLGA